MENLSLSLFHDAELLPLALFCGLFICIVMVVFHFLKDKKDEETREKENHLPFLHHTKQYPKYTKKDYRNLLLVTGCYAIVSLWNLGSTTFPTTTWQPSSDRVDIIFSLDKDTSFNAIYTIYGEGDNNSLDQGYQLSSEGIMLYGSNDKSNWTHIATLEKGSIYQYQIIEGSWNYQYVWLCSTNAKSTLTEIGFRNRTNDGFVSVQVESDSSNSTTYPATLLIDEQDKLCLDPTYENQSYFDEIYHVRNAWEITNGQDMYASVHPLLGTNIMALFIKIFGFSPFVWRLAGALFGIGMIPLLYGIARRLFHSTALATIASVLLAADFMHLTTSRIGTLEPFSVFWILVMYYFMMRYVQMSWYDTPFYKQLKYLFASGLTMGIAIATKWTACYSAVGLAIILFAYFFIQFLDYKKAKQFLKEEQNIPSEIHEAKNIVALFPTNLLCTILVCFIFFIFIPIIIYVIAYIPDKVWKGDSWSIQNVWNQIVYMYEYHANLNATHPYSSTWNQWLLDLRPIWYYNGYDANGYQHTISCFSNPLLTWCALASILFTFIDGIRTKSHQAGIICIGYITALAPWLIITRCVFAYHFYPTSLFAILSIVYMFQYLWKYGKIGKTIIVIFLVAYIGLFIAFLPATAGFATTNTYIKSLEWFSTWYFG